MRRKETKWFETLWVLKPKFEPKWLRTDCEPSMCVTRCDEGEEEGEREKKERDRKKKRERRGGKG